LSHCSLERSRHEEPKHLPEIGASAGDLEHSRWRFDHGAGAGRARREHPEEIIVTATRREQTVQEIPFNISAVSGAALEKANIIDSIDALRSMAGVSMFDRGYRNSGVTNGIVIRGINVDPGVNGDVPLAAPPTVATYVDNTALFGNFILKDIERIEVLRGPQGTLYGSGSLAGNVRYIMKKPNRVFRPGEPGLRHDGRF
jgi:outer membrane receptor protein involved in Fe transport